MKLCTRHCYDHNTDDKPNMRISRVSKDAAKLFDSTVPIAPSRRVTRSFAQFAFATAEESKPTIRDIEDALETPAPKRRRVTTKSETSTVSNEVKAEPVDEPNTLPSSSSNAPRRARKPARKTVDPSTGDATIEPPSDWEVVYDIVRKMRAPGGPAYPAAVDTMGCDRLADRAVSPRDQRFHTLVALMLSSQTKDTVNAVAMKRLQTELPPHKPGASVGLDLENILAVDPKLLNELIWQVGFHNNKTKYAISNVETHSRGWLTWVRHIDTSNKRPRLFAINGTETSPTQSKA